MQLTGTGNKALDVSRKEMLKTLVKYSTKIHIPGLNLC